jgi:hypothetical protein
MGAKGQPSSRKGIPNFEATAEERKLIEMVAGVGLSQEQMCYLIERVNADGVMVPISQDTLARHFRTELAAGKAKTIAKVAGKLVATALGAPGPQATTSQIFYLKTQAGWKETVGLDLPPEPEAEGMVKQAATIAGLLEEARRRREAAKKASAETAH